MRWFLEDYYMHTCHWQSVTFKCFALFLPPTNEVIKCSRVIIVVIYRQKSSRVPCQKHKMSRQAQPLRGCETCRLFVSDSHVGLFCIFAKNILWTTKNAWFAGHRWNIMNRTRWWSVWYVTRKRIARPALLQTRLLPLHSLRHRFREGTFRHRDG